MNWLFFAILAYFIAAIVSVLDKVILNVAIPRPVSYAAWVGIFGIYGLLLVPFGFNPAPLFQNLNLLWLSLGSGAIFIFGLYFLFSAIRISEVSRISPVFGSLVAVFTLIFARVLAVETLDNLQLFAFLLLFFGGVIISVKFKDIQALSLKAIYFSTIGAILFSLSFILIKIAYSQTAFLNAFIAGRIGEVIAGIILLIFFAQESPYAVRSYFRNLPSFKTAGLFVLNKSLAGVFFLLQNYATFLGSASLVQGLSGIRYVFLLLFSSLLAFEYPKFLKEKISFKAVLIKFLALFFIVVGLFILALGERPTDLAPGLKDFGVTFSKIRAEELGLDWQETLRSIFDELGIKKIRLSAYWTDIEPSPRVFNFFDLDWQIAEAERRDANLILVLGQRLPRWPECHIPEWAENLPAAERQERLLKVIELIVNRYKSSPAIEYWQGENEAVLIGFGEWAKFCKEFLDEEIALVKSLDSRPVIVSDSGELSFWLQAARRADIFGTTMYRIIWSNKLPGDGYLNYPLPPSFFHLKANLIKYFTGTKGIIVTELQAEPWGPKATYEMLPEERDISLSLEQFKKNVEYARAVGFREAYLWGVEWWYWEKLNGRPEFWNYAKTLFRK